MPVRPPRNGVKLVVGTQHLGLRQNSGPRWSRPWTTNADTPPVTERMSAMSEALFRTVHAKREGHFEQRPTVGFAYGHEEGIHPQIRATLF